MWCQVCVISPQLEQDFQTFPVGRKEGRKEEEEEETTVNVREDCWVYRQLLVNVRLPPLFLPSPFFYSLLSSLSPLQLLHFIFLLPSTLLFISLNLQPVVVQTSADLKGPERVVVDRLISEKQCQQLMDLASVSVLSRKTVLLFVLFCYSCGICFLMLFFHLMYLHTCTHTHTCTHAHIHTCTHAHMHTHTFTHAHMHTIHTHIHTCTHAHMHTIHTHTFTHAHMHTCTQYMHTHSHMHTFTHSHPHTQYGSEGDGYSQKSPHTTREKFEGLNILEAAKVLTLHCKIAVHIALFSIFIFCKQSKLGRGVCVWESGKLNIFLRSIFCFVHVLFVSCSPESCGGDGKPLPLPTLRKRQ